MFQPKHIKQGKLLLKGVRKFVRYNDDLIKQDDHAIIVEKEAAFSEMLASNPDRDAVEKAAQDLTGTCEKAVPSYKPSAMRENIEVLFVAVVIAMGIRTYVAQPFKIPTGSMQPTLNGIVGHPHQDINSGSDIDWDDVPNPLVRVWDKIWFGRSYVNVVAKEDDVIDPSKTSERTFLKFFTNSYYGTEKGETYRVPGPLAKTRALVYGAEDRPSYKKTVRAGEPIAKGYIETGDQVIVDKFSYHWVRPKQDTVFVFNTRNIRRISAPHKDYGSQHYIKRLVGVPGTKIEVKADRKIYVNDELSTFPGMQKVMSEKDGYRGYQFDDPRLTTMFDLGDDEYLAFGDNSFNSFDSRGWGTVPEKNIVGRALMVYYPFGHHFGSIE